MFFGKEVRVLLKGEAKDAFLQLKQRTDKEAVSIINSFNRITDILKQNPQYGEPIPKYLIPERFKKQGIQNIYRAELSNFWRMLYTLEGNKIEIFLFILSIVDHPAYNKIFGYK